MMKRGRWGWWWVDEIILGKISTNMAAKQIRFPDPASARDLAPLERLNTEMLREEHKSCILGSVDKCFYLS